MTLKGILCCGAAIATLASGSANAATINLIDLGGVTGSPAEQGFKIAASYWGNMLTNNATINLGVRFAALNPGIIGSTGSRRVDYSVANWETRVNATKSSSTLDQNIVLPTLTTNGASFITNGVNEATGNDDLTTKQFINGDSVSSRTLYLNSSVVKAIGGTVSNLPCAAGATANQAGCDGTITFSSNFNFDFNPTNGITANTFDFIGVAIHEIGHALGFVSGVDFLDVYGEGPGTSPNEGILGYSLNDTSIYSALDMFRYSADPTNVAPGTGPSLDLSVGGTKYFSIDGGATALFGNTMSTGRYNGDGQQASHWKDTAACQVGNGLLDPTFCFGQKGFVTGLDLAAYDAMGWNLSQDALTYRDTGTGRIYREYFGLTGEVPEPASWAMLIGGFGIIGGAMRRRKVTVTYA